MKLIAAGVLIAMAALISTALLMPYRGFTSDVFVDIPRGAGTRGIAAMLEEAGVLRFGWEFELVRAIRPSATLQAGEYRFSRPASAREVFDRIVRGDINYFEFTAPEGANMFDIARELEAQDILPAADFLRAAANPAPIGDLAPQAKSLEGFLFPSTYRLTHGITAEQLVRRMTGEFRKQWRKLSEEASSTDPYPARPPSMTIQQVVTLASLVEKETAVAEERPLVASVFANRLAKGMRLECDPTTIYAALLENRYQGVIHRSDLASTNPYNTYQHTGLPPGPIANPGTASLTAALTPSETKYLFFVATPQGRSHRFSESLAQHEEAVASYRHSGQRASLSKNAKGKKH